MMPLVVAVACATPVYIGDGQWVADCPHGCGERVMGHSKSEAVRLVDRHAETAHGGVGA